MSDATRETRRVIASESPLHPNSLCGSYCVHSGGDASTELALVVGEPQSGVYLLEFCDLVTEAPREQRLLPIADLMKVDDEGGRWTFFDERAGVRSALVAMFR